MSHYYFLRNSFVSRLVRLGAVIGLIVLLLLSSSSSKNNNNNNNAASRIIWMVNGLSLQPTPATPRPPKRSSSSSSSSSIGSNNINTRTVSQKEKKKKDNQLKKKFPDSELINRRKSPALWRDDLSSTSSSSSNSNSNSKQYPPLAINRRIYYEPPEVMAPVGGWKQLYAAINNGANSIYLGLSSFSARARATNFNPYNGELQQAVEICHSHGVRVYVALNTLVFDHELYEVEGLIHSCYIAKVDAIIVQDLGICQLIQQILTNYQKQNDVSSHRMELHASTQQTVTSADGVAFCAEQFGSTRVVLGRELSVTEIDTVSKNLPRKGGRGEEAGGEETSSSSSPSDEEEEVEIETFVHGALCVSYSGQCFSSEAQGGRSANRGQCAQACRLPYGLIDNGELTHLGNDISYLLSPQDLCGLDHIPDLIRSGVRCLKIEGRLKDEYYVAATTLAYRQAVDIAWDEYCQEHNIVNTHKKNKMTTSAVVSRNELVQVFSRGQDEVHNGLTPGFFDGSQHQRLVRGRSPRHRGIHIGRVGIGSSWKNGLVIDLDENNNNNENEESSSKGDIASSSSSSSSSSVPVLRLGDGIVVDRGLAQEEELGGAIFELNHDDDNDPRQPRQTTIQFSRDVKRHWKQTDEMARQGGRDVPLLLAPIGAHVWKTHDATVEKKMKRLAKAKPTKSTGTTTTLLSAKISGTIGDVLQIELVDPITGLTGIGRTSGPLVQPERAGLSYKSIAKAIGTLGNTESWTLLKDDGSTNIDMNNVQENVWCPMSWVKEARRQAVEDLQQQQHEASNSGVLPEQEEKESDVNAMRTNPRDGASVISELMDRFQNSNGLQEATTESITDPSKQARLSVLARNYEQVDAICKMIEQDLTDGLDADDIIVDEIYIDFLEVDGMREAVTRIRQVPGGSTTVRAVVASPRIIKPGESGIWRTLLRLEPDALLVRSTGLLYRMMKLGGPGATVNLESRNTDSNGETTKEDHVVKIPEVIGDFSLNVANALTAHELLQYGCSRVTASYDLRALAITELLDSMGGPAHASRIEIVTHAHMPIFHTEHCVFARFLSKGNSYLDCGHVCTRHNVHLRDQSGADNLVLADMGCRNTVFSAQAQSGVHSIKEWRTAGAKRFRIELVDESPDDVQLIVRGYQEVLEGVIKPKELWESLEHVQDSNGRQGGVSLGSFRNLVERRAGELK